VKIVSILDIVCTYLQSFCISGLIRSSPEDLPIRKLWLNCHHHLKFSSTRTRMATSSIAPSRAAILSLYRNLFRTGGQFTQYSFREYARRRTRDAFREHQNETDPERIQQFVARGLDDLEMLKRQTVVGKMYSTDKLVVEVRWTVMLQANLFCRPRPAATKSLLVQFRRVLLYQAAGYAEWKSNLSWRIDGLIRSAFSYSVVAIVYPCWMDSLA
jgi:Complex 1 protein (LYR family)